MFRTSMLLCIWGITFIRASVDLTISNFDATIQDSSVFVKFFSPKCGHCKKLAPIWEKVAANSQTGSDSFHVANVDCSTQSDLCNRFDIRGVPSLIFFKDGKMYKYSGNREYNDLMKFGFGDYKQAESFDISNGMTGSFVSQVSYTFMRFLKDVHAILRFNQWVVFIIFILGFLSGGVVGFMISLLITKSPQRIVHPVTIAENEETIQEKSQSEKKSD
jgi:protein disulfide-isomerase-like protein